MGSASLASRVFAVVGTLFLVGAVVLGLLGAFSYLAAAAIGLFFIAAALISQAIRSPAARAPALVALVGIVLSLVGTVTTLPFLYLGVGLILGAAAIAALLVVGSPSASGRAGWWRRRS